MANYTLTKQTWLTIDGKVATNDLEANELLGNKGDEVPEDRAIALGLMKAPKGSDAAAGAAGAAGGGAPASTSEQLTEAVAEFVKGLRAMKAAQVRAVADEHNVSTEGNADAVRARLIAAAEANPTAFAGESSSETEDDPDVDDSGESGDQA